MTTKRAQAFRFDKASQSVELKGSPSEKEMVAYLGLMAQHDSVVCQYSDLMRGYIAEIDGPAVLMIQKAGALRKTSRLS